MKKFKAESKRLLDLMINSVYTNKEIFLRELISNASDAIDKRHFISLTDSKAAADFKIIISVDKAERLIKISDNGMGMSEADMEENLSTIAKSGTLAFKQEHEGVKDLIGQFGVGFYSAFLVSDEVTVISKAYKTKDAHKWWSRGADGYTIDGAIKPEIGTDVILHIKENDDDYTYDFLLEEYKIEELVKKYSDFIRFPIILNEKVLNTRTPIWKKEKNKVKKEDFDEFYKTAFRDYNPPLKTILASLEGSTAYTTLLFLPEKRPADFLGRDFKRGLMLYSEGVLIMDKCDELLPEYLSFIKGLVDTFDLPLNISREILQNGRQIKNIAASLEKKIISEFSKMLRSDKERQDYEKFFKEFGSYVKFGAYDNFGEKKELLKDVLVFKSSHKEDGMTTLAEYISRMKTGADAIYYACGEDEKQIAKMPKTQSRLLEGSEVLFLTDKVDEFVMKTLSEYGGYKIKSVNESSLNASETDAQKKETAKKTKQYKELIAFLEKNLKGKVKSVRLSALLGGHAVNITCEGPVTLEMEKVFAAMPDAPGMKAEKILELNPDHPVFNKMNLYLTSDPDRLCDYANLLFMTALLQEGFDIKNNVEYAALVQKLL